jgi:CheY-like chemotaxis protein
MNSLRIAIADDEYDMRNYLSRTLARLGHEIVVNAENGRELVDACLNTHPDLIVSDIRMPTLTGVEAMKLIWNSQEVPVVFISAFHHENLSQETRGHTIIYLEKPIKLPILRTALEIVQHKQRIIAAIAQKFPNQIATKQIVLRLENVIQEVQSSEGMDLVPALLHCEHALSNQTSPMSSLNYWQQTVTGS